MKNQQIQQYKKRTHQAQRKKEMLVLLKTEAYGNIAIACQKLGIDRSTYYKWCQNNEDYDFLAQQAIREGKRVIRDLAEAGLVKRISAGDTTAIIFALKNLDKDNYGEGLNDFRLSNYQVILNDPKALRTVLKTWQLVAPKLLKQSEDHG